MRAAALSVVASIVLATTAAAQFPDPLRKAKEKAQQAVAGQSQNNKPIKFDDVVLELTPQVLNKAIAGLRVRADAKGPDGRNVNAMRRRAEELWDEGVKLNENRDAEREAYGNKAAAAQNCMEEVLQGMKNDQYQAMQRRFMGMTGANLQGDQSANAKFMQEYQRISMEVAEAVAAQDTARQRKLAAEYNKLMGLDPKADTAKAKAQCNVPPPPPWMQRAEIAQDSSRVLYNLARDLERAVGDTAVRVSGLTAEQFAMALERLTAYIAQESNGRTDYQFTGAEVVAIKAKMVDIRPLVS